MVRHERISFASCTIPVPIIAPFDRNDRVRMGPMLLCVGGAEEDEISSPIISHLICRLFMHHHKL